MTKLLLLVIFLQNPSDFRQHVQKAHQYHEAGDYVRAEAEYRKALELEPQNGQVCNNLGSVLLRLRRYSEAVEAFTQAAKLLPKVEEIRKNLAQAYFQWEKYPKAQHYLEQYLKDRPQAAAARHLLGVSLLLQGQNSAAIEQLEQLRLSGKPDLGVLYTLTAAYTQAERFSEAQAILEELFRDHGESAELHLLLGQALEGQGQYPGALEEVNRALQLNRQLPLAHFYRGRIFWRQAKGKQAETEFDRELALNPDHAESYYYRGTVRFEDERFDQAESDFRKAVELDPNFYSAHHHLGWTLLKTNRFEEALWSLKKAIEVKPDYAESHYLLGRTLLKMGRSEEAQSYLDRVRELQNKEHRRLQEELRQPKVP